MYCILKRAGIKCRVQLAVYVHDRYGSCLSSPYGLAKVRAGVSGRGGVSGNFANLAP